MHSQRTRKQPTSAKAKTAGVKGLKVTPKRKLTVRARNRNKHASFTSAIPQPQILVSHRVINASRRKAPLFHRQFSTAVVSGEDVLAAVAQQPKTLLQKLGLSGAADITLTPEQHKTFNRNLMIPAALLTHLSLGSVFAWSLFNAPLMMSNGVIEAANSDWTLGQVMPVFSTTMATFGTMSFLSGRLGLNEKFGPRITSLMGGALFTGGFSVAALAASTHTLPLIYLGYGLMAGAAVGVSYVGPVATLMKWFPDRRGLASSLGIVGFGAAGIFAAQFIEKFLGIFRKLPKRVGDASAYQTSIIDGKLIADIDGVKQEVVIATANSLKKLGKVGETLQEGMYLVGSGDTGISNTFLALGAIYAVAIGMASFMFRLPNERYDPLLPDKVRPISTATKNLQKAKAHLEDAAAKVQAKVQTKVKGTDTDGNDADSKAVVETKPAEVAVAKPKFDYIATAGDLKPGNVLKTKQFWFLWAGLACNSAAAYAIIGSAKNLMLDVFGVQYPLLVTSAFAATFVSMISAFNLSGRLGWGAVSDKLGRKKTFNLMWGLSIPLYLGIPFAISLLEQGVDMQSSMLPMAVFYSSVCCAIICFGGSAAISPAYLVDLYGPKYSAANAGQLLSYLMVSGYLGPLTVTTLRDMATKQAIEDLTSKIDIGTFVSKFGATPDRLGDLISSKTVSIEKLMEVVPQGTPDPTPYLYNTVFVTLAALQFIALLCNQGVTKIDEKKFIDQNTQDGIEQAKIEVIEEKSPEMAQVLANQQKTQTERDAAVLKAIQTDSITAAPPLLSERETEIFKETILEAGAKIAQGNAGPAPVAPVAAAATTVKK